MNPKVPDRILHYKDFNTEVKDVDEKQGIVTAYICTFGNKDKVGDIILPNAVKKTIDENFNQIFHYYNHDADEPVGVIMKLVPDNYGLLMTSKLMKESEAGRMIYEFYKINLELQKPVYHSIGYKIVTESFSQTENVNYLKEIMLVEGSTLTRPPANNFAVSVGLKSLEKYSLDYLLSEYQVWNKMINAPLTDVTLEKLELLKNNIENEINSRKQLPPQGTGDDTIEFLKLLNNNLK